MIRSSQVHKICTNRPKFNMQDFNQAEEILKEKVEKKGGDYSRDNLDTYLQTTGILTVARAFAQQIENKSIAMEDPLPIGAKNYLEELWLQNNGFNEFSLREGAFQLQKGNLSEDKAIAIIAEYYGKPYVNNKERKIEGFLSGECDMYLDGVIRDSKCPQDWVSFRKKQGIDTTYYWQLIAYCKLWGASEAYLDYVLMPTPESLVEDFTRGMSEIEKGKFYETEEIIKNLPLAHRIKTFQIDSDISREIKFMEKRIEKSAEYYNTLNYEICMGVEQGVVPSQEISW